MNAIPPDRITYIPDRGAYEKACNRADAAQFDNDTLRSEERRCWLTISGQCINTPRAYTWCAFIENGHPVVIIYGRKPK